MTEFTIYHNPRCSKSRQTLALLEAKGIKPRIVPYLDQPPTPAELHALLERLDLEAHQLLRKSEAEYKTLGLDRPGISPEQLLQAMHNHPRLIQRPIVVRGEAAVLGRPPENVEQLL